MKHTYHIEGMTCSGCEAKVKKDLSNAENVTEVEVFKEDKKVSIIMSKHVEIEVLQNALGGKESKYQISLPINNSKEVVQKSCCSTGEKNINIMK